MVIIVGNRHGELVCLGWVFIKKYLYWIFWQKIGDSVLSSGDGEPKNFLVSLQRIETAVRFPAILNKISEKKISIL